MLCTWRTAMRAGLGTLDLLNSALATEIVSLERCKQYYYAVGMKWERLRLAFLEQAVIQSLHADRIAERITELGGYANFSPVSAENVEAPKRFDIADLYQVVELHLAAMRSGIQAYRALLLRLAPDDKETRALLEEIIAEDEDHVARLARLLSEVVRQDARVN
jgi:bacterioferritin